MATCARCGAEILWKRLHGNPVAVDAHESAVPGEGRYVEHGNLLLRVEPESTVTAYVEHRLTCANARR